MAEHRRRDPARLIRLAAVSALATAAVAVLPSVASAAGSCNSGTPTGATSKTYTCTVGPINDEGYTVKQGYRLAPHPPGLSGFVTHLDVNLVYADGRAMPVQRLMLHHIVFSNLNRQDSTCQSFLSWDNRTQLGGVQRFYAEGEEHNDMDLPPGYGYRMNAADSWGLYYMIMNHKSTLNTAYIQYHVTVNTRPTLKPVTPYWLDVRNCLQDPVYNVRGTGGPGSTDVKSSTFTVPAAGRIVAGGGHVHGGGEKLTITEPQCDNREIAKSVPAWGMPNHPFYRIRPKLHEPGPMNMSAWGTSTGIPIAAGERLRLNSVYDDSFPHMRVMGISIIYIANDPSVDDPCAKLPNDIATVKTSLPHRKGPIPYHIPLTGLDNSGHAVTINHPPGPLKRVPSGSTVNVKDRFFSRLNVSVHRGSELHWRFKGGEVHNLTLANGPVGFASRNLDQDRSFSKRFRRPGTYRFFCALHPVQMSERVVVRAKRR